MDRIGRYRLIGEIGRGAMGVVYRATDPAIGRDVAIKTVRLEAAGGAHGKQGEAHGKQGEAHQKLKERLFREARSAGVLSHPSIVTIYDMGEEEGLAYIAMGLVKGPSLEALLARNVPLPGSKMLAILRQTAAALDYAHSRGVVHRDIKPGNIMTDEDGTVKITDFGIARFAAAERLNETATITGTPNYMSPEQVQGLDADGRTDQFSLGVVAWEILTGEKPFYGDNLSTVVYRIVSEDPLPAHRINPTLTPRINEVLRRVLAKNARDRFANCSSFVGALEMACAESPGWTPVAVGASASLPTVGTHWEPPVMPMPPNPVVAPPIAPQPEPQPVWAAPVQARPRRTPWPWITAFVVLIFAAGALWRQGGAEKAADLPQPGLPTSLPKQQPQAAQPAPAPQVPEVHSDPLPEPPPNPAPAPVKRDPPPEKQAEEPSAPRPSGPLQDIRIGSTPPGARAIIDGNSGLSCDTPCVLYARPGIHHVTVSLPGYRNEYRELRITNEPLELGVIPLQPVMGTLMLSSTPEGAAISINGSRVPQTTPAELPLKPGTYQILLEKGAIRHAETVRVGESTTFLKVPLDR